MTAMVLSSSPTTIAAARAARLLDSKIPPSKQKESAIIASLPPGRYTAVVSGAANSTGVALVEVYKLGNTP